MQDHRDGPSLECAGLSPLVRVLAQLGPRQSPVRFHASWLSTTRTQVGTAPAFGVISVHDATRPEQLVEAGRLYQRLHLEATLHDIAMQPLDQWLEVVDRAHRLGHTAPATPFAPSMFSPVMMFRIGTAVRPAHASARRRLDDVIM